MNPLLTTALAMAVPLEIERLRDLPERHLDAIATGAAEQLQMGADAMQFGRGKPGEAAGSFAAHTRALALLALRADGGVDFLDMHWCQVRGCRAASRFDHADMTAPSAPVEIPRPRAVVDIHLPEEIAS